MFQTNSLRFRVAFYYALFGAGLSILLSGVVYFTVEQLGHRLMDQILLVELYEHASEDVFEPPNTASIKGYVLSATQTSPDIPAQIRELEPGTHNITIGEGDYRASGRRLGGCALFHVVRFGEPAPSGNQVHSLCDLLRDIHDRELIHRRGYTCEPCHLLGFAAGQRGREGRSARCRPVADQADQQ